VDATPFGDYLRQELIGRRDMREVWRDCNPKANRIVALKVLSPKLADDETFPRRFRRELDTAAGLRDPQVVSIHGYGEIDGLYLDVRLIERGTMPKDSDGPLSAAFAGKVVLRALDGGPVAGGRRR
jgi:serine/threonine protein kinase